MGMAMRMQRPGSPFFVIWSTPVTVVHPEGSIRRQGSCLAWAGTQRSSSNIGCRRRHSKELAAVEA